MLLVAKARKTLQAPVIPLLQMGDALVFDYRILHRGRANLSDVMDEDNSDEECKNNFANDVQNHSHHESENSFYHGVGSSRRDRPILVMTFARRWFIDVCNFPKRSLFSLDNPERTNDQVC